MLSLMPSFDMIKQSLWNDKEASLNPNKLENELSVNFSLTESHADNPDCKLFVLHCLHAFSFNFYALNCLHCYLTSFDFFSFLCWLLVYQPCVNLSKMCVGNATHVVLKNRQKTWFRLSSPTTQNNELCTREICS